MKKFFLLAAAVCLLAVNSWAQPCVTTLITDYSNPGIWTLTQQGNGAQNNTCNSNNSGFMVVNNEMQWVTASGAKQLCMSTPLPFTLTVSMGMEFRLSLDAPPPGGLPSNSPGIIVAAVTDGNAPVFQSNCVGAWTQCTSCTYPASPNDAIWVDLNAAAPNAFCNNSQNQTGWFLRLNCKDGAAVSAPSAQINLPAAPQSDFWIRVYRKGTRAELLVFLDANMTILHGSVCYTIPTTITNLNTLQHGVYPQGSCRRIFNGAVDDMHIIQVAPCNTNCPQPNRLDVSGIDATDMIMNDGALEAMDQIADGSSKKEISSENEFSRQGISLYPNPGNGMLNLRTETGTIATITVFDAYGRMVGEFSGNNATEAALDLSEEVGGVYFLRVDKADGTTPTTLRYIKN